MPRFLDRLPFHCWVDNTRTPPQEHWSVVLSVLLTDAGLPEPPAEVVPQLWCLDTGARGEAFAWRRHLLDANLDPDQERFARPMMVTSAIGGKEAVAVRPAQLWLVSNLPSLQSQPYRMELFHGLPFRDVPFLPDPEFHRPLIGMRALLRARLRVELDFAGKTISIWIPDEVQ